MRSSLAKRYGLPHDQATALPPEGSLRRQRISLSAVIGPSGRLVGIEPISSYPPRHRAETAMVVPHVPRTPKTPAVNFLWGKTDQALGISSRPASPSGFRVDTQAFEGFRALHKIALHGMTDTALEAFLKFLDRWSPEDFRHIADFQDKLGLNLVFRFQYDDEFMHERHAARLAWKRMTEQELEGVQLAGLLMDERALGPS
jgi:CRISPR-associated protein Csd1